MAKNYESENKNSRNYAKRQLTWFRREKDVIWVNKNDFHYDEDKILEFMLNELKNRKIVKHTKKILT